MLTLALQHNPYTGDLYAELIEATDSNTDTGIWGGPIGHVAGHGKLVWRARSRV